MTPNQLAFVALCNEYCVAVETPDGDSREMASRVARLLPRIYICATDLANDAGAAADCYVDDALDEQTYDQVRSGLERAFGEDDTYLEVFEEDMKYSDTPIGASIAEGLADLFQVFYNMLEAVRDAPDDVAQSVLAGVHDDFTTYWSQTLCNVMRPINNILYQ